MERVGQRRERVPEGVALLDANQNGDYICHPREVAYIQDKLPRVEKLEYIRSEKGYHGSDFTKLKPFLAERLQEKEELGKLGTVGKEEESKQVESKQVKKKCEYCSRMGHTKEEYERGQAGEEQAGGDQAGCKNKVKSESGVKSKSGCWVCGESGHKSFNCPESKWTGKAGKGGRTSSNQETQSNNLRKADVPRCKSAEGCLVAMQGVTRW